MPRAPIPAPSSVAIASIGLFVDRFPVLSETFVANEARTLGELGVRVTVEARRRPDAQAPGASVEAPTNYASEEGRTERLIALAWLALRHPRALVADVRGQRARTPTERGWPVRRLAPRARRLARVPRPLHIHTHFAAAVSDDAYRIARLLGVPSSVTAHAYDIYVYPGRLQERLSRSHFSTSGCEYTVAELRRVIAPRRTGSVFRQVMGVDATALTRSSPLPGGRHVVAVGRLVEKKGFIHLVEAAARAPDISVTIAGEGPERSALEREIASTGMDDRVKLVGAVPASDVPALLEGADLLCMPCVIASDGDRDSMPVVVKEAMAMELLVVASDEVGLPELVNGPWGRLAPPGDPEALASAIAELLALSPDERARAGAAGRAFVREHADVRTETAKLLGFMERAADGPL